MEKPILISGHWDANASPALLAALQEMVLLAHAQVSKPVFPAVDEPHQQGEGAEQHSADDTADN